MTAYNVFLFRLPGDREVRVPDLPCAPLDGHEVLVDGERFVVTHVVWDIQRVQSTVMRDLGDAVVEIHCEAI